MATEPLKYENNVNTVLQIADPGVGAKPEQYGNYENITYYHSDGGLWLGPGQRFDLSIDCRSPLNFFISHTMVRFDGPQMSVDRPHRCLRWYLEYGSPSFVVTPNTGYGGELVMQTNLGFGTAIVEADYVGTYAHNGMVFYCMMYTDSWTYQNTEIGWRHDDNNRIWLSRADYGGVGNWIAHCRSAGYETALDTGIAGTGTRTVFAIAYDSFDYARFFLGNWNNTLVDVAKINTNVPKTVLLKPYIRHGNIAVPANMNLYVSHLCVIRNT